MNHLLGPRGMQLAYCSYGISVWSILWKTCGATKQNTSETLLKQIDCLIWICSPPVRWRSLDFTSVFSLFLCSVSSQLPCFAGPCGPEHYTRWNVKQNSKWLPHRIPNKMLNKMPHRMSDKLLDIMSQGIYRNNSTNAPDRIKYQKICQNTCQIEYQNICQMECQIKTIYRQCVVSWWVVTGRNSVNIWWWWWWRWRWRWWWYD